MMNMTNVAIIRRGVSVTTVPYGEPMMLQPGQEVLITQEKGSNFTLSCNGNLVFLDGKDADAIGREIVKLPSDEIQVNKGDDIDEDLLWKQIQTIYDPEISVNIVDLGLIYSITSTRLESKNYHIGVQMTLTAPGCGMGPILVQEVENKIKLFANVERVDVVLLFDPPWNSEMMTEEAKLELGLF